jgi:hypothetical protein
VEYGGKSLPSWTRICGEVGKCIRRAGIVRMQITNKIIRRMHRSYAVLYTQGTPTSAANVSPDEGIHEVCPDFPSFLLPDLRLPLVNITVKPVVLFM